MLNIRNLSQSYLQGKEVISVLKSINKQISSNLNIGLIGPSGSGKSTLLNLIGLLEKPISGIIEINGVDSSSLNPESRTNFRRENIGFIFQNNQLLEDFTCEENVALPLILNGYSYHKAINKSKDALIEIGLGNRLKFKPSLLSGGEQQRVAVLRALIKKPKILLADEPTGSLDKRNSEEIFRNIINLSKEQKTLCITATHNLALLKHFDICFEIVKGDLVERK